MTIGALLLIFGLVGLLGLTCFLLAVYARGESWSPLAGPVGIVLMLGGGTSFVVLFLILLSTADWGTVPG